MKDSTKNSAPIAPTKAGAATASAAKPRVAKPENGKLVKKKNTASGGATGTVGARSNVKASGKAAYGIKTSFQKQVAPEAGSTQANGKILPSAIKRQSDNWSAGMSEAASQTR